MNWQLLASSQSTGSSRQLGLWVSFLVIKQGKDCPALPLSFAGKTLWYDVGFLQTTLDWPNCWIMDWFILCRIGREYSSKNHVLSTKNRSGPLLWKYLITMQAASEILSLLTAQLNYFDCFYCMCCCTLPYHNWSQTYKLIIYVHCLVPTCISYHSPVEGSTVGKHAMVSRIVHVTIWPKSIIKRISADIETEKWNDMTLLLWKGVTMHA